MGAGLIASVVSTAIVAAACIGGADDGGGEAEAATDAPATVVDTDADPQDAPASESNRDVDPSQGSGTTQPTTPATGGAGSPGPAVACTGDGYELVVPAGWFHFECRYFNVEPITVDPDACSCQFPIDVAVVRAERYDAALTRIESSPTWSILGRTTVDVDGRPGTRLDTVVDEAGRELGRRIYVIDQGPGTLFLAATDGADQAPRDLVFDATIATSAAMVDSLALG